MKQILIGWVLSSSLALADGYRVSPVVENLPYRPLINYYTPSRILLSSLEERLFVKGKNLSTSLPSLEIQGSSTKPFLHSQASPWAGITRALLPELDGLQARFLFSYDKTVTDPRLLSTTAKVTGIAMMPHGAEVQYRMGDQDTSSTISAIYDTATSKVSWYAWQVPPGVSVQSLKRIKNTFLVLTQDGKLLAFQDSRALQLSSSTQWTDIISLQSDNDAFYFARSASEGSELWRWDPTQVTPTKVWTDSELWSGLVLGHGGFVISRPWKRDIVWVGADGQKPPDKIQLSDSVASAKTSLVNECPGNPWLFDRAGDSLVFLAQDGNRLDPRLEFQSSEPPTCLGDITAVVTNNARWEVSGPSATKVENATGQSNVDPSMFSRRYLVLIRNDGVITLFLKAVGDREFCKVAVDKDKKNLVVGICNPDGSIFSEYANTVSPVDHVMDAVETPWGRK